MLVVGSEAWTDAIKFHTEEICSIFKDQEGYMGFEDLAYRYSRTLVKEIRDYVYYNCTDIALGRVYPESEVQKYVQDSMRDIVLSGEYYEYNLEG